MVRFFFFLLGLLFFNTFAQKPQKRFEKRLCDSTEYSYYYKRKKIPNEIKSQVLTTLLFYPELKNTKIIFRYRNRKTPLTSRPQLWGINNNSANRTYIVTISNKTIPELKPILFTNLPYNAQIGVLGHELAHISSYNKKNIGELMGLSLKLLQSKNVDVFEFETDRICIEHGLGYQLKDWSQYVQKTLNIPEWRGASKGNYGKKNKGHTMRYMDPKTIMEYISKNPIYNN